MNYPLVSIIVVNWNGISFLGDCLDSLQSQNYPEFEVIVVDNASSDGSVAFVRQHYPDVKLICLETNTGFTGGNISGFNASSGEFVVLLNNDAVLVENWLRVMVEALLSDSSVGWCSSRIIISGTDKIDSAGDIFTNAFSGTKSGEGEAESLFHSRRFTTGACAAAVIYRRIMLDQIGFLDEDFFFNHEDSDLNLRAWLAGWKCLFVPEAKVYHKVSASIGELSDTGVYYFARNNVWVWIKNTPIWLLLRFLPHRILYEASSFAFFCVVKRKWRPFLLGKRDALLGIFKMLKKRRKVQQLVVLSTAEIVPNLMPITEYLRLRLSKVRR